jgi:hypothetical protein
MARSDQRITCCHARTGSWDYWRPAVEGLLELPLGERLTGSTKPGLNGLVEDEHHIVPGAEFAYLREVAGRRNDDADFPLDRLDEEGRLCSA